MGGEELSERLFQFALETIKLLRTMSGGKEMDVIKYQLSKASTSVGANYEEAQAAISRKEFGVKVAISLKEMREAKYWYKLLIALYPDNISVKELYKETEELTKILGKINAKIHKSAPL